MCKRRIACLSGSEMFSKYFFLLMSHETYFYLIFEKASHAKIFNWSFFAQFFFNIKDWLLLKFIWMFLLSGLGNGIFKELKSKTCWCSVKNHFDQRRQLRKCIIVWVTFGGMKFNKFLSLDNSMNHLNFCFWSRHGYLQTSQLA